MVARRGRHVRASCSADGRRLVGRARARPRATTARCGCRCAAGTRSTTRSSPCGCSRSWRTRASAVPPERPIARSGDAARAGRGGWTCVGTGGGREVLLDAAHNPAGAARPRRRTCRSSHPAGPAARLRRHAGQGRSRARSRRSCRSRAPLIVTRPRPDGRCRPRRLPGRSARRLGRVDGSGGGTRPRQAPEAGVAAGAVSRARAARSSSWGRHSSGSASRRRSGGTRGRATATSAVVFLPGSRRESLSPCPGEPFQLIASCRAGRRSPSACSRSSGTPVRLAAQQETGFDTSRQWRIEQLDKDHAEAHRRRRSAARRHDVHADEIESFTDTHQGSMAAPGTSSSRRASQLARGRPGRVQHRDAAGHVLQRHRRRQRSATRAEADDARRAGTRRLFYGEKIEKVGPKKYKHHRRRLHDLPAADAALEGDVGHAGAEPRPLRVPRGTRCSGRRGCRSCTCRSSTTRSTRRTGRPVS